MAQTAVSVEGESGAKPGAAARTGDAIPSQERTVAQLNPKGGITADARASLRSNASGPKTDSTATRINIAAISTHPASTRPAESSPGRETSCFGSPSDPSPSTFRHRHAAPYSTHTLRLQSRYYELSPPNNSDVAPQTVTRSKQAATRPVRYPFQGDLIHGPQIVDYPRASGAYFSRTIPLLVLTGTERRMDGSLDLTLESIVGEPTECEHWAADPDSRLDQRLAHKCALRGKSMKKILREFELARRIIASKFVPTRSEVYRLIDSPGPATGLHLSYRPSGPPGWPRNDHASLISIRSSKTECVGFSGPLSLQKCSRTVLELIGQAYTLDVNRTAARCHRSRSSRLKNHAKSDHVATARMILDHSRRALASGSQAGMDGCIGEDDWWFSRGGYGNVGKGEALYTMETRQLETNSIYSPLALGVQRHYFLCSTKRQDFMRAQVKSNPHGKSGG
ncbi:hypothetical protein BKA70DRAFT_1405024 [Coprinopsis sp. MPI-PUGE-AT-0042]|nr:hypothetical protein BKA70DRAFT_1405024 [Coprinopsis sp. MPI-PUGE-AT-0042]